MTRKFSSCWIVVLLLAGSACSSARSRPQTADEFAGIYSNSREGAYEATGIELHTDGTFVYSSFSCFSSRETTGEWTLIAPNLILANSFVHQEPSPLEGRIDRSSKTTSVTVVDIEGIGLPGTRIAVECQDGNVLSVVSGPGGIGILEPCRVKAVSAKLGGFQDAEATSLNPKHSAFTMTLRTYPWFQIQDRLWYIHEGQLFELSRSLTKKERLEKVGND